MVAVIEFAFCFSLLWAAFTGAFQYGYSMWIYNGLLTAVSNGAAYGQRAIYDTRNTSFQTEVKNMAVYGNPGGSGSAVVPGLTPAKVNVAAATDSEGVPKAITVSINNYTVNAIFSSWTFNGKPSTTVRFGGTFRE